MSYRAAARLAWSLWAVCVVLGHDQVPTPLTRPVPVDLKARIHLPQF